MRPLPDLSELDDWLAQSEARVPGLRPQCAKHIIWPSQARTRADVALVYIHGFSASPRELAPVPERLAAALNAPLFATRLTGHGQDGEAMARATLAEWEADVAGALSIGAALGRRIIVMGCSTGCTLLTIALGQGGTGKAVRGTGTGMPAPDAEAPEIAGAIFVSPNFKMASRVVQGMLMAPGVRTWGPVVAGATRSFPPISDAHAAHWTNSYPTSALWPMADAMRKVYGLDLGRITTPALFATCQEDTVISPAATRAAAAQWGGAVTHLDVVMGPGDDRNGHVIAGDIMSPGQTGTVADAAIDWARSLL